MESFFSRYTPHNYSTSVVLISKYYAECSQKFFFRYWFFYIWEKGAKEGFMECQLRVLKFDIFPYRLKSLYWLQWLSVVIATDSNTHWKTLKME